MTSFETVEQREEFKTLAEVIAAIQVQYPDTGTNPRWASWWDQIFRSSQGVLLNWVESSKGQGYYRTCLMVARAECQEALASCCIGPDWAKALKPKLLAVAKLIDQTILDCPEKPTSKL